MTWNNITIFKALCIRYVSRVEGIFLGTWWYITAVMRPDIDGRVKLADWQAAHTSMWLSHPIMHLQHLSHHAPPTSIPSCTSNIYPIMHLQHLSHHAPPTSIPTCPAAYTCCSGILTLTYPPHDWHFLNNIIWHLRLQKHTINLSHFW